MTPAELDYLAWHTRPCRYTTCRQPVGRRCLSTSGKRVPPHAVRVWDTRVYLEGQESRQPDLDAQAELTRQAEESRDLAQRRVGELATEVEGLTQNNVRLGFELRDLRIEIDAGKAREALQETRWAEHMATEHPAESRTLFGACPEKPGGTSLAAAQGVVDKWGKGAAVRQFLGGVGTVAQRPVDAGIVHISWKEFNQSRITEASVTRACANLLAGDCVEVIHESDNDGLTGADLTKRIALKSYFYDTVKAVRPDLLVVNTVTGWLMDPKSGKDPSPWGQVKADVLGIDCDGIRPTKLPYTNYEDETTAALAFVEKYKANGYRYVAVPEFGCPRIPALDPDGKIRAEYHAHYADLWTSSGFLYVTLYEYDSSPHYSLTTPAEIDQWRSLVA